MSHTLPQAPTDFYITRGNFTLWPIIEYMNTNHPTDMELMFSIVNSREISEALVDTYPRPLCIQVNNERHELKLLTHIRNCIRRIVYGKQDTYVPTLDEKLRYLNTLIYVIVPPKERGLMDRGEILIKLMSLVGKSRDPRLIQLFGSPLGIKKFIQDNMDKLDVFSVRPIPPPPHPSSYTRHSSSIL